MKIIYVLLAALWPTLAHAVAPGAYGCQHLGGADDATVRLQPREVDVACTVDMGTVSHGAHRIKVFARPPERGSAYIIFSFTVAKPGP